MAPVPEDEPLGEAYQIEPDPVLIAGAAIKFKRCGVSFEKGLDWVWYEEFLPPQLMTKRFITRNIRDLIPEK